MKRLLVKNGRIVTMSAQGTLENGQLLIEDGKTSTHRARRSMTHRAAMCCQD